jgi:pimeloyl-ACP methyl ester carboxylesterase
MTSTAIRKTRPLARVSDRYQAAERAFWAHHGLEPRERFVELDQPAVRLRVVEIGSGEPVLFVHGSGAAGAVWAPLVRALDGYRCFVLDRPGWVFSEPVTYAGRSYGTLVADLLDGTLAALGVERAHVVGSSVGNLWTLRFAARHGSHARRLVLVGGGPLLPEVPIPGFIRAVASPLGAVMVRVPQRPDSVRSQLRRIGHGEAVEAGRLDAFVDWRCALTSGTASLRHERDMVRAIVDWRHGARPGLGLTDDELAAIEHPTLHVFGTADPVGSPDVWQRMADRLPRGELQVIESAGHLAWLDDPAAVARRIEKFLAA